MTAEENYQPGLAGVISSKTDLSYLDVEKEEIVIRGYDLIELAEKRGYLDLVGLLLDEVLPDDAKRSQWDQQLKAEYELPSYVLDILEKLPKSTHPMDALRSGISVLSGSDEDLDDRSHAANQRKAVRLLSKVPNLVAGSYHILYGEQKVEPDASLSYSANFLYMITGRRPSELEQAAFDQALVVYSEHEMPNSTFAARVIASTHSDIYGAFTGAVSSLKGHLHGGANEAVMNMLLEAETVEGFRELLQNKLANKERIMGFGHRVYMKKMDPRARLMKQALQKLAEQTGRQDLYDMCEAGEEVMAEEKGLYPNLDYYAAPVFYLLDIPIALYTPIFFAARAVGLAAHVMEQHENNRLFRPRVWYTGPRDLHP